MATATAFRGSLKCMAAFSSGWKDPIDEKDCEHQRHTQDDRLDVNDPLTPR